MKYNKSNTAQFITNAFKAQIFVLAALLAVSCGNDAPTPDVTETTASTPVTDVSETEAIDFSSMSFLERIQYSNAQLKDNLPDVQYNGDTFTIWVRCSDSNPVMASEENGEIFNDASYAQKRTIEERFNLAVEYFCYAGEWTSAMKMFNSNLMSGDYFADLVENWNAVTAGCIVKGYYMDISGFDVIDPSKPWYFADEMDSSAYCGKIYSAVGFMNPKTVFDEFTCTFFNKDIANNYDLEDMYQVVRDGRWTLDYAMNLCKDFYYDLNGDGSRDLDDIFGFVNDPLNGWYHGFAQMDIPMLSLKDDGSYSLSLYDNPEKCQIVLDKLREFNNYDSNIYGVEKHNIYNDMFPMGNALFAIAHLKDLDLMKDVDFDYGVLPRFKASEEQKYYYTTALNNPWSVPISTESGERSAIIMTAYAAEGYKQVVPVCYEKSIKTKNVVDEESGEMIDLMLQNFRGEPLFYYTDTNKFSHHTFMQEYLTSKKGYGSFMESKEKKIRSNVESMLQAYAELAEQE